MARRWLHILAAILLLAAVSLGSYRWAGALSRSLYAYQPPFTPPPPVEISTPPIADRVVLVVISGLRTDVAANMPTLQHIADSGARAIVRTALPTYLQPTWTALLTGASPELLPGNLLGEQPWELLPIPGDHLVAAAVRAGRTVALASHQGPQQLISRTLLRSQSAPLEQGLSGDRELINAAVRMWIEDEPNLLIVQLDGLRLVSAERGALSDEALAAAEEVDALLDRLLLHTGLRSATVVVTSDRGLTQYGGYGGAEWEVTHVPLAAAGVGIRAVDLGDIDQISVAPTLAALLGVPISSLAQGEVLKDALDLPPEAEAALAASRSAQRAALATFYLASVHADPRAGSGVASSSDPLEAIAQYRAQRESAEQLHRLPLAVAVVVFPLVGLLRRPTRRLYLVPAALVALLGFHIQFGHGLGAYSFSAMRTVEGLLERLVFYAFVSCGAAGALSIALLWTRGQRSAIQIWEGLLELGVLSTYLLTVPVACTFVLVGYRATWFIPDVRWLFAHFLLLLQLALTPATLLALSLAPLLVGVLRRLLMALTGRAAPADQFTAEVTRAHRRYR